MSVLTGRPVKVLGSAQRAVIDTTLAADPYLSCIVAAKVDERNGSSSGQFWGINGGRSGLCFVGANLVPISGDERAMRSFAAMAGKRQRHSASICGRRELVLPLWEQLERRWGSARAVRDDQPFLLCTEPPAVRPDPLVRPTRAVEIDAYFPAAVAMFTEEIGVDPRYGDGGRSYRARVEELIHSGRSFVRFDGDELVFKAEIGAVSPWAALIQGVWVTPHRRGEGLAAAGVAAVVQATQSTFGRPACLYVNDFNVAARAAYRRVGFHQIASYASVLF